MYLTVVPAYGRDYKSKKAVLADWNLGFDFQINDLSSPYDGAYVNVNDKPVDTHLTVRYSSQQKVMVIQ